MASSATKTYYVGPEDGWVKIVDSTVTNMHFFRLSAVPHSAPFLVFSGAAAPSLTVSYATATATFATSVPTNGQKIVIQGPFSAETYTFKTTPVDTFDIQIGASAALTAASFTTAINTLSKLATAVNVTGTVTLTAILAGSEGNYTLKGVATGVTLSGNFTGGTDLDAGVLTCHHPFIIQNHVAAGNTAVFYVKVPDSQASSTKGNGKLRIDAYADGGVLQ